MKVVVNNDLTKSIRKLSKFKSMAKTVSAAIKQSKIFKKDTTKRREKILAKKAVIRDFKKSKKNLNG